ncbi:Putative membrane protein YdgH, partial [Frankliniella fusca]
MGSQTLCANLAHNTSAHRKDVGHLAPPFPASFYVVRADLSLPEAVAENMRVVNMGLCLPASCGAHDVSRLVDLSVETANALDPRAAKARTFKVTGVRTPATEYLFWEDPTFWTLMNMYMALVDSLLRYGILAWGFAAETYLEELKLKQQKILRCLCGGVATGDLFKHYNALDVKTLFMLKFVDTFYNVNIYKVNIDHPYSTRAATLVVAVLIGAGTAYDYLLEHRKRTALCHSGYDNYSFGLGAPRLVGMRGKGDFGVRLDLTVPAPGAAPAPAPGAAANGHPAAPGTESSLYSSSS